MKIIFAGNNKRAQICLKYLSGKKKMDIALVIGHPKNKTDNIYFSSLKQTAKLKKLPYIAPKNINSQSVKSKLNILKPDLMILVGYSAGLLKKEIYDIPKLGTINLHASLLPKYRGASPLNWILINGEKEGGISIIKIDEGIDTGDILAQKKFKIQKKENILTLTNKVNKIYPKLLYQTILKIKDGKKINKKQKIEKGSFYGRRLKKDGYINFKTSDSFKIDRLIRSLIPPFPGAFFFYNGKKIIVTESELLSVSYHGVPGRIAKLDKSGIVILAKDRGIKIKKIKVSNSKTIIASKYPFKVGTNVK